MSAINLEKAVDVPGLSLAVFSTFAFEPEYFEYRLLRQTRLGYARRILVLMDRSQYTELLSKEIHPRNFNRRYLVVPVPARGGGVFHPKLHLLAAPESMKLICGSANLTSSGFSHNLEVATVHSEARDEIQDPRLWQNAFDFFSECLDGATGRERDLARYWLDELKLAPGNVFDRPQPENAADSTLQLLHSAGGQSLLAQLKEKLGERTPDELTVLSPFFDKDFRVLNAVRSIWPDLPVKVITQENNGVVPVEAMGRAEKFALQGLAVDGSRRLHAKILVFHVGDTFYTFAGSANFTEAALLGRNVEAGILLRCTREQEAALWGPDNLSLREIEPARFESGKEFEPDPLSKSRPSVLVLNSAELHSGKLHLAFQGPPGMKNLSTRLRSPGGKSAQEGLPIPPVGAGWSREVAISDEAALSGSAYMCELAAEYEGASVLSNPVWLVFSEKLTYEQSAGSREAKVRKRRMEETGEGTLWEVQQVCDLFGWEAAIAFLNSFGIRYDSGDTAPPRRYGKSARPHDPWRPDRPNLKEFQNDPKQKDFESKVYEFVERHRKGVLKKHIRKPNPAGVQNFVNVIITLTDCVHGLYQKGLIRKRPYVIDTMSGLLDDTAAWKKDYSARKVSYLSDMDHAGLDKETVRKALREACLFEHAHILLALMQRLRNPENPAHFFSLARGRLLHLGKMYELAPDPVQLPEALALYQSVPEEDVQAITDLISANLQAEIPQELFCDT